MLFSRRADRDGGRLPRGAPGAARGRPGDGRELRRAAARGRRGRDAGRRGSFPLATVVTPNLAEAEALVGRRLARSELAERIYDLGATAVIVTGGHGAAGRPPLRRRRATSRSRSSATRSPRRTAPAARIRPRWRLCSPAASRLSGGERRSGGRLARGCAGPPELGAGDGPVDVLAREPRETPAPTWPRSESASRSCTRSRTSWS